MEDFVCLFLIFFNFIEKGKMGKNGEGNWEGWQCCIA